MSHENINFEESAIHSEEHNTMITSSHPTSPQKTESVLQCNNQSDILASDVTSVKSKKSFQGGAELNEFLKSSETKRSETSLARTEGRPVTKQHRAKINMRERKRMHDLNKAMDSLREVIPYANGPSVRKLSKIATLYLARNYIQMLTKSVDDLRQMLNEAYRNCPSSFIPRNNRLQYAAHPYVPYPLVSPSREFRGCLERMVCLSPGQRVRASGYSGKEHFCRSFECRAFGCYGLAPDFNESYFKNHAGQKHGVS